MSRFIKILSITYLTIFFGIVGLYLLNIYNIFFEILISFVFYFFVIHIILLCSLLIYYFIKKPNISFFSDIVFIVFILAVNVILTSSLLFPFFPKVRPANDGAGLKIAFFSESMKVTALEKILNQSPPDILILNQISEINQTDPTLNEESMDKLVKIYPFANIFGNKVNQTSDQNYPACHNRAKKGYKYNLFKEIKEGVETGWDIRSCIHGYTLNRGSIIFSKYKITSDSDEFKRAELASNPETVFKSIGSSSLQYFDIADNQQNKYRFIITDIGGFTTWYDDQLLNESLLNLEKLTQNVDNVVIFGDFNAVPWSNNLKKLQKNELKRFDNVAKITGFQNTWRLNGSPCYIFNLISETIGRNGNLCDKSDYRPNYLISLSLDQAFISDKIKLTDFTTLDSYSEHLGIQLQVNST